MSFSLCRIFHNDIQDKAFEHINDNAFIKQNALLSHNF